MAEDNCLNDNSTGTNSSQPATNSIESLLYHATAEELDPLFDKIKLPLAAREKSKEVFQNVFSHGIFSSDPKIPNSELFASILYIAVIETSSLKESALDLDGHKSSFPTLTDILMATNVNINKVFMSLQMISEKVHLSEAFRHEFYNLTQRYLVISVLFKMFQSKCGDVFQKETKENDENAAVAPPIRKTEGVECRKKLCWVLFLLTKNHLLPNSPELYLHFQLLLCCLEYVLSKTPMFLLNSAYATIRFRSDSLCEGESMLEKLAKDFGVNFIETQALQRNSTETFFKGLSDSNDDIDCDKLCDKYKKISSEPGALNELLFLSNDARIMPLQVSRGSPPAAGNNSLKLGQMTPIRGTLNAVHHLERLLHGREEEPEKCLKDFLKGCSPDPTDHISELVKDLKNKFLMAYQSRCEPGSSQYALGQQRLSQGTKLFYKVLESIVNKNSDKSTETVLSPLLNKDKFIRSVFAFSMEIILATYGHQWDPETKTPTFGDTSFPFPWILQVLSLKAYTFDIMLVNFMWTVENLSADIIKYIQNLCHQILEKLAWVEDSPLYDALAQSEIGHMLPPSASPVKGLNGHSHFELLLSPGPSSVPVDKSASNQQDNGSFSASLPKRRSQSLTAFLTKVNKLAFSRISSLCNNLDLSEKDKDKIWTCFDFCLRENFTLMKNRHIDQIIICCIHGMCKALNHKISLEMIVDQYKKMPHAKSQVYEHVFISSGEISPISDFYDKVFEESKTREKVLQFSQTSSQVPPLSPRPKFVLSSPRPCSHLGKPNLTISPMNTSAMRSPGKFSSRIGSSVNPQSPTTFKMINEKMSAKSQSLQRTVRRLDFDDTSQQSSDFKQRKLDSCKLPMA